MVELIRKIATTKMSEVWEGHLDGKHIALKKPVDEDMLSLLRFVKEAKYWQEISDLNIAGVAKVLAIDEDEPWFAVEYVTGVSLEKKLKNADTREIMRRMLELLRILDVVHQYGYLHLDIKPSNILIDKDGDMMILDWGLAARIFRKLKDDVYTFIGTPSYAPPEMWDPDKYGVPDSRSDVYEVGTTFYKILVKQVPFTRKSEVLEGKIRPFPNTVPHEVRKIILKAINPKKEKRYKSAMDMYLDVRNWLKSENVLQRGIYKIRFKKSLTIYYDHNLNFVADINEQKKSKGHFAHLGEQSREKRKIAEIREKSITAYKDGIFVRNGRKHKVKPVSSAELYHGTQIYYKREDVGKLDYGARDVVYADFVGKNIEVAKRYFSFIYSLKESGRKVKIKQGGDNINIIAHRVLIKDESPDEVVDHLVYINNRRIHIRLVPKILFDGDMRIDDPTLSDEEILIKIMRCEL